MAGILSEGYETGKWYTSALNASGLGQKLSTNVRQVRAAYSKTHSSQEAIRSNVHWFSTRENLKEGSASQRWEKLPEITQVSYALLALVSHGSLQRLSRLYHRKKFVSLYSKRMQIEETFRDLKCPRFGLGLYHNRTYKLERMRILVMLCSLATNFAWVLGRVARSRNLHKQFQANTTLSVNVLSNVFLGMQILKNSQLRIPWSIFKQYILELERQPDYPT